MRVKARLLAMMLLLSATSPGAAQRLGGAQAPDVSLARVFLALFVCLIIAFLAILLVRQRYGGRGLPSWLGRIHSDQNRIRVIESRRIGPGADLSLIECDTDEYLLLITSGSSSVLRQRPLKSSQSGRR